MSAKTIRETAKLVARVGMCLFGTGAMILPLATSADAQPVIIRGIPAPAGASPASTEQPLAYLATFPDGSLRPAIDRVEAGAMQPGDTLIPNSNPTFTPLNGEYRVGITRPLGLTPDQIPAASLWATPVNFGPGSILRIRTTFIAPAGPYATTGGFAIGVGAKTGGKDDLPPETEPRVFVTVNARPNQLVRFQVPFGSVEPSNTVLPQAVKDAIYSTTDPQPFTIELTIDRKLGKGTAKLMVIDQVFSLSFTLSEFLADGGPTITAVGPGIAVNSNAPGQTATVRVRDFRIYTSVGE